MGYGLLAFDVTNQFPIAYRLSPKAIVSLRRCVKCRFMQDLQCLASHHPIALSLFFDFCLLLLPSSFIPNLSYY